MNSDLETVPCRQLSSQEIAFYQDEGYLVLRQVFFPLEMAQLADEAERVRREHAEAIQPRNLRVRFKPHYITDAPLFEVFDPFADLSEFARRIALDRRILDPLGDLYGEPAELFKEKLIYKPAGAMGSELHQDWISWPTFPKSFLTVLLSIDPFTEDRGPTEVYPRVHQRGYLSPRDGQHHTLRHDDMGVEPISLQLEPGDVAIFGGLTPHRAGPNRSSLPRRGYYLSYNARSDGGDQYASHYREFHEWIRARVPEAQRSTLYFQ